MSTYAIGDIQGCHDELVLLLDKINFDARRDRLWFVGDLVNRGPKSAATLRLIRSFGEAAVSVLGNHDLFMLASAKGFGKPHPGDTFEEVLNAPDAKQLLDWLTHQKLAHMEDGWLMVHAGVLPSWKAGQTVELAREAEHAVRHDPAFFSHMRGNQPAEWGDKLTGYDRLRVIVNALTRLRFCTSTGRMDFTTKTEIAPPGHVAWYEVAARRTKGTRVLFGHWAARGLTIESNLVGLDTGCVWGRTLTAMRLDNREVFEVACLAGAAGYGSA